MKNTFGNQVALTIFGESHGNSIGVVIDGLAPGISVNEAFIAEMLSKRRPYGEISTKRREPDLFQIESGVFNGKTTGTPICIRIPNTDTKSGDYEDTRWLARPSHADYTANCKYHGFEDYRGGGHFSGRLTAALVAAGGILIPALESKGIYIGTHITSCGGVKDRDFSDLKEDIKRLNSLNFAVLDENSGLRMIEKINESKANGDSVGGVLETAVIGLEAGLGEPWFDTLEGLLSHALFSIPAVKGVEFGLGFGFSEMTGKTANDSLYIKDKKVAARTNNNGGINGGISNGEPLLFRCAVKPTPTISLKQNTVNMATMEDAELCAKGRHDPCIVHRARAVVDSVTALVLCDILAVRHGTDWLGAE